MTYARALAAAGFATIPRLTAAQPDELVSSCRTPRCASSASVAHTDTFLRDLVHATRHEAATTLTACGAGCGTDCGDYAPVAPSADRAGDRAPYARCGGIRARCGAATAATCCNVEALAGGGKCARLTPYHVIVTRRRTCTSSRAHAGRESRARAPALLWPAKRYHRAAVRARVAVGDCPRARLRSVARVWRCVCVANDVKIVLVNVCDVMCRCCPLGHPLVLQRDARSVRRTCARLAGLMGRPCGVILVSQVYFVFVSLIVSLSTPRERRLCVSVSIIIKPLT
jgi:hypothetical protein